MESYYDVVIYKLDTGVIEAVIGRKLTEDGADRREMTGLGRINEAYGVETLPHNALRDKGWNIKQK